MKKARDFPRPYRSSIDGFYLSPSPPMYEIEHLFINALHGDIILTPPEYTEQLVLVLIVQCRIFREQYRSFPIPIRMPRQEIHKMIFARAEFRKYIRGVGVLDPPREHDHPRLLAGDLLVSKIRILGIRDIPTIRP